MSYIRSYCLLLQQSDVQKGELLTELFLFSVGIIALLSKSLLAHKHVCGNNYGRVKSRHVLLYSSHSKTWVPHNNNKQTKVTRKASFQINEVSETAAFTKLLISTLRRQRTLGTTKFSAVLKSTCKSGSLHKTAHQYPEILSENVRDSLHLGYKSRCSTESNNTDD